MTFGAHKPMPKVLTHHAKGNHLPKKSPRTPFNNMNAVADQE